MVNIAWIIFELLVSLFQSGLFIFFAFSSLNCKPHANRSISYLISTSILFGTVVFFNYITLYEGAAALVYSLIVFISAVLFLNGSIWKKLLIAIIPTCCMAIANIFGTTFTSLLFHQTIVDLLSQSNFYRVFVVLLVNIILFLMLYVIRRLFRKNDVALTRAEWTMMTLVLVLSILVFTAIYFTVFSGISESGRVYIAGAVLFLILIDLAVYFLLIQLSRKNAINMENNLLKQQYKFQSQSVKNIKQQYESLQKIRHDFHNTLQVIQELNKANKAAQIDEYISQYLEDQLISPHYISTNNDYVNAVINAKLAETDKYNITVFLNVIAEINFSDPLDLCSILGNMFNNAIDACKKCSKDRKIYFSIANDNENIILFLRNSIPESVLKKNPSLISDKHDKLQHGYGTTIIKELAEKHHGFADFYEEDGSFCCNVVL